MKYEAIHSYSPHHSVEKMCKVLGLKSTAYHQWNRRRKLRADRERAKAELVRQVRRVFEECRSVYGYRKMRRELTSRGVALSEYKVRHIMRSGGMYPITTRRFRPARGAKASGRFHENRLRQDFATDAPNKTWVGDITYIKTNVGWVYLATVIDLFNREVVGYSTSKQIGTELVKQALSNALARKGSSDQKTVFHSDRGTQYASRGFQTMLAKNGIEGSMSRGGCPYDNAVAESFFSIAKRECIHHKTYRDFEEVRRDLFSYIELFYNRKRMHSSLGYRTPVEYRMEYPRGLAA